MKKMILTAALAGLGLMSKANTLEVNNYTGCTYSISLIHGNFAVPPTTSGFPLVFTSPTPDDIIIGKIDYVDPVTGAPIFNIIVGLQPPYFNFGSSGSAFTACSPNPVIAIWSQATATSPAYLTIF